MSLQVAGVETEIRWQPATRPHVSPVAVARVIARAADAKVVRASRRE